MNAQQTSRKSGYAVMTAGTMVVLLLAGSVAWAGKHEGKIHLKKDASAPKAQQDQAVRQMPNPFRDMVRLQREMESLFGNTLNPYSGVPAFEAVFDQDVQQAMDLRERPDALIVQMDLPGLEKSDIVIEVKDNVLTVSGERKQAMEQKKGEKVLMQERSVSSFSREIVLPKSVDTDAVSAEYKAGVLTITLPKAEKDKEVRKIKIK